MTVVLGDKVFQKSPYNALFVVVNSVTLFLMSGGLLFYGRHIQSNLLESTSLLSNLSFSTLRPSQSMALLTRLTDNNDSLNLKLKYKILSRINTTLLIVLVCYAVRIATRSLMLVFFFSQIFPDKVSFLEFMWLFFSWMIPSLPVCN